MPGTKGMEEVEAIYKNLPFLSVQTQNKISNIFLNEYITEVDSWYHSGIDFQYIFDPDFERAPGRRDLIHGVYRDGTYPAGLLIAQKIIASGQKV